MVELKSKENIGFFIDDFGWAKIYFFDASNKQTLIGEISFSEFLRNLKSLLEPAPSNSKILEYRGYNVSKFCALDNGPTLIFYDDLDDKVFIHIRSFMNEEAKASTVSDFILSKKEIKKWIKILEKKLKYFRVKLYNIKRKRLLEDIKKSKKDLKTKKTEKEIKDTKWYIEIIKNELIRMKNDKK